MSTDTIYMTINGKLHRYAPYYDTLDDEADENTKLVPHWEVVDEYTQSTVPRSVFMVIDQPEEGSSSDVALSTVKRLTMRGLFEIDTYANNMLNAKQTLSEDEFTAYFGGYVLSIAAPHLFNSNIPYKAKFYVQPTTSVDGYLKGIGAIRGVWGGSMSTPPKAKIDSEGDEVCSKNTEHILWLNSFPLNYSKKEVEGYLNRIIRRQTETGGYYLRTCHKDDIREYMTKFTYNTDGMLNDISKYLFFRCIGKMFNANDGCVSVLLGSPAQDILRMIDIETRPSEYKNYDKPTHYFALDIDDDHDIFTSLLKRYNIPLNHTAYSRTKRENGYHYYYALPEWIGNNATKCFTLYDAAGKNPRVVDWDIKASRGSCTDIGPIDDKRRYDFIVHPFTRYQSNVMYPADPNPLTYYKPSNLTGTKYQLHEDIEDTDVEQIRDYLRELVQSGRYSEAFICEYAEELWNIRQLDTDAVMVETARYLSWIESGYRFFEILLKTRKIYQIGNNEYEVRLYPNEENDFYDTYKPKSKKDDKVLAPTRYPDTVQSIKNIDTFKRLIQPLLDILPEDVMANQSTNAWKTNAKRIMYAIDMTNSDLVNHAATAYAKACEPWAIAHDTTITLENARIHTLFSEGIDSTNKSFPSMLNWYNSAAKGAADKERMRKLGQEFLNNAGYKDTHVYEYFLNLKGTWVSYLKEVKELKKLEVLDLTSGIICPYEQQPYFTAKSNKGHYGQLTLRTNIINWGPNDYINFIKRNFIFVRDIRLSGGGTYYFRSLERDEESDRDIIEFKSSILRKDFEDNLKKMVVYEEERDETVPVKGSKKYKPITITVWDIVRSYRDYITYTGLVHDYNMNLSSRLYEKDFRRICLFSGFAGEDKTAVVCPKLTERTLRFFIKSTCVLIGLNDNEIEEQLSLHDANQPFSILRLNLFLTFYAHILQCPNEMANIAIIYVSTHGCGKSSYIEFICNEVIGSEYCLPNFDIDGLASNFNVILKNKLLINLQELGSDDFQKQYAKHLKSKITDRSGLFEPKGFERTKGLAFARYNGTTNESPKPEAGDRRLFIVRPRNDGNDEYKDEFKTFYSADSEDKNIRGHIVYNYLKEFKRLPNMHRALEQHMNNNICALDRLDNVAAYNPIDAFLYEMIDCRTGMFEVINDEVQHFPVKEYYDKYVESLTIKNKRKTKEAFQAILMTNIGGDSAGKRIRHREYKEVPSKDDPTVKTTKEVRIEMFAIKPKTAALYFLKVKKLGDAAKELMAEIEGREPPLTMDNIHARIAAEIDA